MRAFRILLVDDDPALLRLAQAALEGRGYTSITTAGTALERIRTAVKRAGEADGAHNTDPLGVTAPGAVRPWALVTFSAPSSSGALARASDLALHLPFDPALVADLVVQAVEKRRVGA